MNSNWALLFCCSIREYVEISWALSGLTASGKKLHRWVEVEERLICSGRSSKISSLPYAVMPNLYKYCRVNHRRLKGVPRTGYSRRQCKRAAAQVVYQEFFGIAQLSDVQQADSCGKGGRCRYITRSHPNRRRHQFCWLRWKICICYGCA